MDIDAKLRPLYLLKILKEQTDENHKLSTVQLCQILKDEYGIDTFRTTIKTDIEALQQAGYMIRVTRSSQNLYNYQERDFDSQEIKVLLDAVSVSRMLSGSERDQLMNKLYKLAGPFKTHELKRNWISQKNNSQDISQIMQIIEAINDAINKRRKIKFKTFTYNVKKKPVPARDEQVMSPCFLFEAGAHAYVAGYGENNQDILCQRIDRIFGIPEATDDLAIVVCDPNLDKYISTAFGMKGAEIKEIELQVDNSLMDEVIDRFGSDVTTYACDQNSFRVVTLVGTSQAFYNWVFSFQGRIKIKGPDSIRLKYEQLVRNAAATLNA